MRLGLTQPTVHRAIKDLETFAKIAGYEQLDSPEATPLIVLIPAFVTSELQTAFIIGFMFFIPFLIVDLELIF